MGHVQISDHFYARKVQLYTHFLHFTPIKVDINSDSGLQINNISYPYYGRRAKPYIHIKILMLVNSTLTIKL